jgi:hypothetical protein
MRIDEIDLFGNLLISGSTGSEGQILTYGNDGGFAWGTASGGSSGSTSSYFKTSGYNYVICETVNNGVDPAADAVINGTNLINAYNLAKNLDVGTKSATNRVVVLLMPGDYDLSSAQFQLDTSFIDLVGISTNPYNAVLRSSTQYATLQYTAAVDSSLKNVNLKQGTSLSVDDNSGAGEGSYLRWENLILSGNTFFDGGSYGFSNIYGEFKNIKVLDNCYSFVSFGVIDGIFDNIEVGDSAYAFYNSGGGDIIGTFSNITIGSTCYAFQVGGGFYGRYENIKSGQYSSIFISYDNISGYFENIKTTSSDSFVTNNSGDITGTFKNLNLAGSYLVLMPYNNINGTFENIDIGDSSYVFSINGSGYITGTFSNIKIGNVANFAFTYGDPISGIFKNITIGNVGVDVFKSNITSLVGEFENITIGNVTNNAFKATDLISGSFKNITIGDITTNNAFYADGASGQILGTFDEIKIGNIASTTGYFFSCGATMSGAFSNIEIGDASEWVTSGISSFRTINESIIGSYKNIKSGSTSALFESTYDLNGTFENIEFSSTYAAFRTNSGSILGTYSNIKTLSQQTDFFRSNTDLIGIFENIEISSAAGLVFYGLNNLSGTFKNIKLGDLSGITGTSFYSGTDLTGTFENIEVGNGNSSYDIFESLGNIIGTFSNITVGDNFAQVFNASGNISGYYKDITIGDLGSGRIFYGTEISVGTTIDNLYSITRMYSTTLKGRLINSTIIDSVNSWNLQIDVSVSPMPIVENCKLITNGAGGYSIVPVNGPVSNIQILYTATNEGFNEIFLATSNSLMSPNFNIADAGLT